MSFNWNNTEYHDEPFLKIVTSSDEIWRHSCQNFPLEIPIVDIVCCCENVRKLLLRKLLLIKIDIRLGVRDI